MKRLVAFFLQNRSAWQLVAIAAVCTSAALWMIYGLYSSTLKMLQAVLIVLFGVAGAALVMAVVRRSEDIGRGGERPPTWGRFIVVVLGLAGLIAFVTYSFGHHRRTMIAGCNGSLLPETLAARKEALAGAEAALRSPFALLPRLVDDEAGRECERSREDLARVEQGLCTRWVLTDLACKCGDEQYPYERCSEPRCLYEPGKPDIFDCPGDPIRADRTSL
jgi:hypothetical protein